MVISGVFYACVGDIARSRPTSSATAVAMIDGSSGLLSRPKENRMAPIAWWRPIPIDFKTADGSCAPE
jgi:hypothetical protein